MKGGLNDGSIQEFQAFRPLFLRVEHPYEAQADDRREDEEPPQRAAKEEAAAVQGAGRVLQ